MVCPKCGNELPEHFLDPESWEVAAEMGRHQKCSACGLRITKKIIWQNMKPSDCKKVQNEEIQEDEFESYDDGFCIDCVEGCIFAKGDGTWDYVQDEEGNWAYPSDIDSEE